MESSPATSAPATSTAAEEAPSSPGGPVTFPEGFLWGAATSAYQIEGGVDRDGRGSSVWDIFTQQPGAIRDGTDGDVAVDHRSRFREDVQLMAWLGLNTYRFSVSWPRVQPDGRNAVSQQGLDFYDALVDELLAHDIEPMVTLFHWDLPYQLQESGGWAARETAERFADYAGIVHARLHDRVGQWVTVNEPRTHAFVGHAAGVHAPGLQDYGHACAAVHHQLLGHGLAAQAIRATDPDAEVGFAPDPAPVIAQGDRPEDHDIARRVDGLVNRLFLDPVLLGRYPADVREDLRAYLGDDLVLAGDEKIIGQPLDFLGVNYYRPYLVQAGEMPAAGQPSLWPGAEHAEFLTNGDPLTDNGWIIEAPGLTDLLVSIHRRYPAPPMYITENGAAYNDEPVDGAIQDDRRIRYLDEHLRAVHAAIRQGVDVRGYMVWSLLDNFEWEQGYSMRFGLVHVDYETLERTPKASAGWYRDVIEANALPGAGQRRKR
jgi:beta-glucosidase